MTFEGLGEIGGDYTDTCGTHISGLSRCTDPGAPSTSIESLGVFKSLNEKINPSPK